jgi:hypothetical protein
MMRRVLTQVANAAVNSKGSVFQTLYRKLVPRLGHNKAIWALAHRLCRLIWKILHQGVRYIEFGTRTDPQAAAVARQGRRERAMGPGWTYQTTTGPRRAWRPPAAARASELLIN